MEKNKRDNLKKQDIVKSIYLKSGISSSYASKFLEDTIDVLISGLKKDGILKIKQFGSFTVLKKNKRIGRNPKDKKTYEIKKRKTISFKASKSLKKRINNE